MPQNATSERATHHRQLRLIPETVPGVLDLGATPLLCNDLNGPFVGKVLTGKKEHNPQGANGAGYVARHRAHTEFPGLGLDPDYKASKKWLEAIYTRVSKTTVGGIDRYIYRKGAYGSGVVQSYSAEFGHTHDCDRAGAFYVSDFELGSGRKNEPSASLSGFARKPVKGVAMSGTVAQNAVLKISATNPVGDGVFAVKIGNGALQNVTAVIGDTTAQTVAKFAAIGLTVAVAGTIPPALGNPTVAPTLGGGVGGTISQGSYKVAYSYVSATGETLVSPVFNHVLSDGNSYISTYSAPALPAGVTGTKWYMSANGGNTLYLQATKTDNQWTNNANPATTTATAPSGNTNSGNVILTVTAPANTPVSISKVSGAGWACSTTQAGSSGAVVPLEPAPLTAADWAIRRALSYADLGAASAMDSAYDYKIKVDDIYAPHWTANGTETFDRVKRGKVLHTAEVSLDDANSGLLSAIEAGADDTANRVSVPAWYEFGNRSGDNLHALLYRVFMAVSSDFEPDDEDDVEGRKIELMEIAVGTGQDFCVEVVLDVPAGTFAD